MTRAMMLAIAAGAWFALACGNDYWSDAPASYRAETIHLGEVRTAPGARALGLAEAGRAGVYGADAVVTNPAALANLTGAAAAGGAGYWSRGLTAQQSPDDLRAQSFYGSFTPAFAAAAYPLTPNRFALGAAAWVPNDFVYNLGGEGGAAHSRGALYAVTPAAAAKLGPLAFGAGGDLLFGNQHLEMPGTGAADYNARGYDIRGSASMEGDIQPGWKWAACAFGRKGQTLRFTGADTFDLTIGPAAGGAFSLRAKSINVHLDYVYTFYENSSATDADLNRMLAVATRDVGWALAGAEYVTADGPIVRAGIAYRPWYISTGENVNTKSLRYAFGLGFPTAARHGRFDTALAYGRRAALDVDGYFVDEVEAALSYNYYW